MYCNHAISLLIFFFFFSSRRRHTIFDCDWSSDVCSSDLVDDGETANTQMAVFDYGDALLIFEVRGLPAKSGATGMDRYRGSDVGQVIEIGRASCRERV